MKILKIIDDKLEEWLLVASLIVMVIFTFIQVVMRYIFKSSITWSQELITYIFLWQVWLGVSFAVKKQKHLRVEMLVNKLSPDKKRKMMIFVNVVWLIFSIYIATIAFKLVGKVARLGQLSPALQIPMTIPYSSVLTGFVLMSFRLVQQIYYLIRPSKAEGGK